MSDLAPNLTPQDVETLRRRVAELEARVARDAEDRARAEAALRESEARYRTLVEYAPLAIVVNDEQTCLYANQAAVQLFGAARLEDLVGRNIYTMVAPDDRESVRTRVTSLLAGQEATTLVERRLVRLDGTQLQVEAISTGCNFGGRRCVQAIFRDITPRKRVEEALRRAHEELERRVGERTAELTAANAALRESEARYRLLADHATDVISRHAPDGRILYISPACRGVSGFEPEELLGVDPYTDLFHPDDMATVRTAHQAVLARPKAVTVTARHRRKDGSYVWLETTTRAIRDPRTGSVREIIAVSRDVSERRQMEESARRREAELAHVVRVSTMGEMVTGLAHELKQPLTAIVGYAAACERFLQQPGELPERLIEGMRAIAAQAERAGEIIRRLRDFVRKSEERRERVSINDLLTEAAGLLGHEARQDAIRLELDLAPDLPPVDCDPIQIVQVAVNLLRNALEALNGLPADRRVIRLRSRREGANVAVAVTDRGPGIAPADFLRIFDTFFTTKPDGLGVGLAISRTIIEAHQGRLWAENNPDGGAIFHFTLPAVVKV